MSNWSSSIYSEPNCVNSGRFLAEIDASLYEHIPMKDPVLEKEAREWANRFPHFRVLGTSMTIHCLEPILPPVRRIMDTQQAPQRRRKAKSVDRLPIVGRPG